MGFSGSSGADVSGIYGKRRMTGNTTREAAIAIIRAIGEGALPLANFTDDATWWMLGQGTLPIVRMNNLIGDFQADRLAGKGRMDIVGVTADGDRVAVEAKAEYPLRGGATYSGDYHFLLRFEGDKVREVREYFDTAHAARAFASNPEPELRA